MSHLFPAASQQKTLQLDNGTKMTIGVGDILRHIKWDTATEDQRYINMHLYRVTGFGTLPSTGEPTVLIRQIWHPMREYMYTLAQLQTKADPAKFPNAKQEYTLIQHDVQFQSLSELVTLDAIPKDMISYIRFQEDPKRSEHFKSYYRK
ncbi:MAG: hypothetical protein E7478_07930 [Ruminococcaceae bacterium]|nr:hypothetical protein [Oscillospiraceae bacterium]